MKGGLLVFLVSYLACSLSAQKITTISSKWGDSFVEWEIFTTTPDTTAVSEDPDIAPEPPEEELAGEMKLRWLNVRDDWSEWDYRIGDEQGIIKQKWKDDITQWELRSFSGNIVTMRTAWGRDPTEWRVTDNTVTLSLKSRYTSQLDEWLVQDATRGKFYIYTLRTGDPRDWAVEDDLDETVTTSMKLAMLFLTTFITTPKE